MCLSAVSCKPPDLALFPRLLQKNASCRFAVHVTRPAAYKRASPVAAQSTWWLQHQVRGRGQGPAPPAPLRLAHPVSLAASSSVLTRRRLHRCLVEWGCVCCLLCMPPSCAAIWSITEGQSNPRTPSGHTVACRWPPSPVEITSSHVEHALVEKTDMRCYRC